jgi:hypothetical protein
MNHCSPPSYDRFKLHGLLRDSFSVEELRSHAFFMGVDHENLSSQEKDCFIREFLLCLERSERIQEYIKMLEQERPQGSWDTVLSMSHPRQRKNIKAFQSSEPLSWPDPNRDSGGIQLGRGYPLAGAVRAGIVPDGDELEFCGYDFPDCNSAPSVVVPEIPPGAQVVAYRVKGNSMEDEYILDGDLVFVEMMEDFRLFDPNSLIVTLYIPDDGKSAYTDESTDAISMENLPLHGPTLKRYKGWRLGSDGQARHLLGRIRDNQKKNPYEIEAAYIRPIGRVLAIYRTLA